MALTAYKKKRSFSETPEPKGGKPGSKDLRFVVQKHDASHLHYDFRLEMEGVLKSWAVPKGPSMDPQIKRLAMMVEDHPYDYRNFEGIIPKGQYGGGTVIVWDEGTYHVADDSLETKKAMEQSLLKQLKKGKLTFILEGEKLKGEFVLVKSSYQGEQSWLLMKVKDRFSKTSDITQKDKSVISGKSIAQMEKDPDKVYGQTKSPGKAKSESKKHVSTRQKKASTKKSSEVIISKRIASKSKAPSVKRVIAPRKAKAVAEIGTTAKFPATLSPMLATLVDKPFVEEGWVYEVKWDGYRAVAHLNKGKVHLKSRNNKSFDEKFYPVLAALEKLDLNAVLDGEVVVSAETGVSDFGKLQNWRSEADGQLIYYVFDLLWYEGRALIDLPLEQRRKLLKQVLPEDPMIRMSEVFESAGNEFYEAAKKMGLEGIMAKKADSLYSPGIRTREWLKIKIAKHQEVVIGGYTKNEGSAKKFSSLLVGVYEKSKLVYTGKIGTGFNSKMQDELMRQFKSLVRKTSPFETIPDINKPSRFRPNPPAALATWLEPKLVCEVNFTEMTTDGVMRHPSFIAMREDKKAKDVKADKASSIKTIVKDTVLHKKKILTRQKTSERKTLLNPTDEQQERSIGGHTIKFTNLSKIYWPDDKVTKRDMLNYYYQVAPFMLPHLKERPQSLNRYPNGIKGKSFYQKNVTGKVPDWIDKFPYVSQGERKNFMMVNKEADLLYMASLGSIEINPWSSRMKTPDNPDWCAIDLDPDKNSFEQVIETAVVTHQLLESAGIANYCKTSGSTGIHIYIPLGAKYPYEASREFGRLIATLVHEELPKFTSIERATRDRKGKIYIDFLQNRPQATLAAVYSLRPKPGATVSMPLHWDEVKKGLNMRDFNIHNAMDRIRSEGDIFKAVLGKGINMAKAIENLKK